MTIYNRGDVVLVPFPFSNQTIMKKRPVVIISSDVYNNTSSDIVIMAITGKTGKTFTIGECLIEDWKIAGLLKPSSIKPAISTIEQSLVLKKLGKLSHKDLILMENALKEFLDLK
ncbi:MAG: type II toxin-antitoxin system PemK/MazF family toxin [Planctomycetes bacterium]|uniref:type II toxin-antitoxin system PemK/MazF family toxin n=1 Tax=Candidatus Wunengus sp. YC65 TaxID=3367701 RepID=UPI001DA859D7|nr:type II toxin-antitoxin system PemK/MazF family toxin [Planctomycetota bacterium]MBI5794744.1 type II toxin-antitoxin system PemK/MazF family toxin [Planctomycetota bacterium]